MTGRDCAGEYVGCEAGSVSAYRFITTGVLENCVAKGMKLFTKALVAILEGRRDNGDDLDGWSPRAFRISPERLAERFKGRKTPFIHTTARAERAGQTRDT